MKKFLATLNGQSFEAPPIWLMRQAGRYLPEYRSTRAQAGNFLDLCYTPTLATEVTLQPIRRYGFDAAILFSDILVVPHALGQDVSFADNHGPLLGDLPPSLSLNESAFHVNLSPVYETVSLITETLKKEGFTDTALIGFSGAPWTLACYMIDKRGSKDFAATRVMALTEPQKFSSLIDILTETVSAYLIKQIGAGADVVQIFDSWAGVLPPQEFQKWVIEPTTKIVQKIRSIHPSVPIIGFPKGAGVMYPDYVRQTRVTAVGIDTQTPVDYVRHTLQPLCPVQGNLDPFTLVAGGAPLTQAIDAITNAWKGKPYIFNLGHGIDKSTPPDHVKYLVNHIRGIKT